MVPADPTCDGGGALGGGESTLGMVWKGPRGAKGDGAAFDTPLIGAPKVIAISARP